MLSQIVQVQFEQIISFGAKVWMFDKAYKIFKVQG